MPAAPVCTSRIIQIRDALVFDPTSPPDDDEFDETLEDMRDGCKMHGKINEKTMKIIRPGDFQKLQSFGEDAAEMDIGNVFLEFVSLGDANEVMTKLHARKYDGRFLKYVSFPEDKFFEMIVPL